MKAPWVNAVNAQIRDGNLDQVLKRYLISADDAEEIMRQADKHKSAALKGTPTASVSDAERGAAEFIEALNKEAKNIATGTAT